MPPIQPYTLTAVEIARRVTDGSLAMRDVCAHFADRTETLAKDLNTHLHWDRADVEAQVARQSLRLAKGESMPLAGVPIVVKDNICVKDEPTSAGSRILEGYRPPYDAHVIERLRDAGAILFGKSNCDEFAMGSSNENSAYGAVRNPWDRERVPGGSSGGSAAVVAAGMAPVALGSDTGGSIRQPAGLCGVVGLKPSYGRVSRYGLMAYGSSLDQIGPITRNVTDAALLLDVLSGRDRRDSTCFDLPATNTAKALQASSSAAGIRVGVVKELMGQGLDPATRKAVEAAIAVYRRLGATVTEVSLPYVKYSIASYYIIATAEASANLARYDGVRYGFRHSEPGQSLKQLYKRTRSRGFGREVKQRIMLGTFVLSSGYYDAYYAKANRARELIRRDFDRAFQSVDLLISPTSPTTAFKLGEKSQDPLSMYLSDICTLAVNLAGLPGISIPCGLDECRLPVGLQLIGPALSEETLLKGAYLYEQAEKWVHELRPNI